MFAPLEPTQDNVTRLTSADDRPNLLRPLRILGIHTRHQLTYVKTKRLLTAEELLIRQTPGPWTRNQPTLQRTISSVAQIIGCARADRTHAPTTSGTRSWRVPILLDKLTTREQPPRTILYLFAQHHHRIINVARPSKSSVLQPADRDRSQERTS